MRSVQRIADDYFLRYRDASRFYLHASRFYLHVSMVGRFSHFVRRCVSDGHLLYPLEQSRLQRLPAGYWRSERKLELEGSYFTKFIE